MKTSLKSLLLAAAVSLATAIAVPTALGVEACPNEQLRIEDHSTALPECRAYELVSPDSNHADIYGAGRTAPSGDMMVYLSNDAPDNAKSGLGILNYVRSTRDADTGWQEVGLAPPLPTPISARASVNPHGISSDLSTTFLGSDQPLSVEPGPPGLNYFAGHADGTFTLLSRVATPFSPGFRIYPGGNLIGSTADFSHVYFSPSTPQFPSDPSGNFYGWSAAHGLRLTGILPDGTPVADGASFQGNSEDGRYVAFTNDGTLYLRIDEERTVKVGELALTPGTPGLSDQLLVSDDSGSVLFTSRTRQTSDANQSGKDLYSYDIATDTLTDLTVDTNPADAATGAEVRSVLGASVDGSYIYFAAAGDLAEGATQGHTSLYVSHDGAIQFLARADGLFDPNGLARQAYLTPDGHHLVFVSTDSLTGYDNTDPTTGRPHTEVFEATIGAGIVCASCRPDGTRPTGNSILDSAQSAGFNSPGSRVRNASDDGRRVFFQSTDAVVPQASNGLERVYEYSDGKTSPISAVDSSAPTILVDASASGSDVFLATHDELIPNPNGGDSAIYDARVDGGFPVTARHECSGAACRTASNASPALTAPLSASTPSPGNLSPPTPARPKPLTRAQKLARALKACHSKHNKKIRAACEKKARRTYGRGK